MSAAPATPAPDGALLQAPVVYLGPDATSASLQALRALPVLGQGAYGVVFGQGRDRALKLASDCLRLEEAGYRRLHRLGVGPALYEIQVLASDVALSWSRLPASAGGAVAATVQLLLESRGCDCPPTEGVGGAGHCLVLLHLEAFDCDLTQWGYPQQAGPFAAAVLQPVAGLLQRLVLEEGLFPFDQKPANVLLQLGRPGEDETAVRRVVFTDLDDSNMCTLRAPQPQTCDAALLYFLCTCKGSLPQALWRLPGWCGQGGTSRFSAAWDVLLHEVLPRGGFRFWTIYAVDALDCGWEAYLDLLRRHVTPGRPAGRRFVSKRWLQSFLYRQGLRHHRLCGQSFWEPLACRSASEALARHGSLETLLFCARRLLELDSDDCCSAVQTLASICCGGWERLAAGLIGPLVRARFGARASPPA